MSTYNWRSVSPEPVTHYCDCGYCDMQGADEDKVWALLVEAEVNGVDHITDRRLMLRVKVAPIPENYEGTVIPGPTGVEWPEVDESWMSANGLHFLELHLAELDRLGWTIWQPVDETRKEGVSVRCAVVDEDGFQVGWIMSCKPDGNYSEAYSTRAYAEATR